MSSITNSLINTYLSPITGRVLCDQEYVLVGDRKGIATPSPSLIDIRLDIIELKKKTLDGFLPDLTYNKIWVGDSDNRPQEVDFNIAANDAKYVIQQPYAGLSNAQALSNLGSGIVKNTTGSGVLSIASSGTTPVIDDYVAPQDLIDAIAEQAEITTAEIADAIAAQATITTAEIAASAAATEAAAFAAFAAEMLPYIPTLLPPIATIGEQISAAIVLAETGAVSTANAHTNSAIAALSVSLEGDISGTGLLSSSITTSFKLNPQFFGHEYIQIPFGNTSERPTNPNIGMLRQNTELGMEYYNGYEWVLLSTTTPPIPPAPTIDWEYATDLVYGVLNNVNGIFTGFASESKNYDLKIQTSYCNDVLSNNSSSSVSLLDRHANGYITKNLSYANGYQDYYLQHVKQDVVTNLLQYDSLQERFTFFKPFSKDSGSILNIDEAVDLVTGVLNNVNGIFNEFASDNQHYSLKIKSSYTALENETYSAGLSLFNRENNGFNLINVTNISGENNFVIQNKQNNDSVDLLSYLGGNGKFVFHQSVEVPTPVNNNDAVNKYYVDNIGSGVTAVLGTVGQINSSGGTSPQISLADTNVTAGNYTLANINVDEKGRITSASNGQAVTSITATDGLSGGTITNSGIIGLSDTNVTAGNYTLANINVDEKGRITSASNGQAVTSIFAGNGISGGVITSTGSIGLTHTPVTPGNYTNANISVDQNGRITSASNGASADLGNFVFNNNDVTTSSSGMNFLPANGQFKIGGSLTITNETNLECGIFLEQDPFIVLPLSGNGGFIYVGIDNKLHFVNQYGTYLIAG